MQVAFLVDAKDEAVEVVLGRRDGVLVDDHLDGLVKPTTWGADPDDAVVET